MGKSASFTEDDLAWLREFLSTSGPGRSIRHVVRGETLYTKGSVANYIYMVLRGQIRLVSSTASGDRRATNEIAGPHRWFYEDAHELGHYHTAEALTDSDVVVFPRETFGDLLGKHRPLLSKFLSDTAAQLERVRSTLDDQLLLPADKRLAGFFLAMFRGKNVDSLPLETTPSRLAELIGTSRQNLHRIIAQFRFAGIVTKRGAERYIINKMPLEKFYNEDHST